MSGRLILSVDEKTGIQAKEPLGPRLHPQSDSLFRRPSLPQAILVQQIHRAHHRDKRAATPASSLRGFDW